MYSTELSRFVAEGAARAGVAARNVTLLDDALVGLLSAVAERLGGTATPQADHMQLTLRLLLINESILGSAVDDVSQGLHYLLALGFEQTAGPGGPSPDPSAVPRDSDDWMRRVLAFLNYSAGGFRIQSQVSLRHLQESVARKVGDARREYEDFAASLSTIAAGGQRPSSRQVTNSFWWRVLSGLTEPTTRIEVLMAGLVRRIRGRKQTILADLGEANLTEWLAARGLGAAAVPFWADYVGRLKERGIASFTPEQIGPGFGKWLVRDQDMLVVLPTGSGKTIVGELKAALALAGGGQVVWLVPTRALVRQTRRILVRAFQGLDVSVAELPVSEDPAPLFFGEVDVKRRLAITTPERLAAFLRVRPDAASRIALVVIDEAQILFEDARSLVAEHILHRVREANDEASVVLMTGFRETTDGLRRLLSALGRAPVVLSSELRPSRRIYGVLTSEGQRQLVASVYRPHPQSEEGSTEVPLSIRVPMRIPRTASPPGLAARLARAVTKGGLRSVVFVARKDSAETQARFIAATQKEVPLGGGVVSRLKTELGRASLLLETATKAVAPHHASLSSLEQHIVEEWVMDGQVRTVVATPTLAQGMNLPFDLSLLTFTERFNVDSKTRESLPVEEVMNMLGRAGRAGMVADGICLLVPSNAADKVSDELNSARRFFFARGSTRQRLPGMAGLLSRIDLDELQVPQWPREMTGVRFGEAQALITFLLSALEAPSDDLVGTIQARLEAYPTLRETAADELRLQAEQLANTAHHIAALIDGDELLAVALRRTGLPLDFLAVILDGYRTAPSSLDLASIPAFADGLVRRGLEACARRGWFSKVFRKIDIAQMMTLVSLWRSGSPIATIESSVRLNENDADNRRAVGEFVNRQVTIFAQFWGALCVVAEECRDADIDGIDPEAFRALPSLLRSGVPTVEALSWLQALGGYDRVLATRLSGMPGVPSEPGQIEVLLRQWRGRLQGVGLPLSVNDISALGAVLDES